MAQIRVTISAHFESFAVNRSGEVAEAITVVISLFVPRRNAISPCLLYTSDAADD